MPPAKPAERSIVAKITAPSSAEELERHSAGQRKISTVWEVVQAALAVMVTSAMIFCGVKGLVVPALDNAFTLIVALYFVRTNHTKIGGPGGTDSR